MENVFFVMEWIERMVGRLRKKMSEKDIASFLVTESSNISYMVGMNDFSGVLYVSEDEWQLFVSKFFKHCFPNVSNVSVFGTGDELKKMVSRKGESFVSDKPSFFDFDVEQNGLINDMRLVKDDLEIDRIREACRIGDSVFESFVKSFKPGMTEWECVKIIDSGFREKGVYNSFDTLVHRNSVRPHRLPTDSVTEEGDLVIVDMGCKFKNYCGDMTRMVPTKVSGRRKQLLEDVISIQEKAVSKVRPGISVSELCGIVGELVEDAGYSYENHFLHSLGHGLGVDIHEAPNVSEGSDFVLEEGNVITIEPGLYIEELGGCRIEDTVAVNSSGAEVLTRSRKKF